MRTIRGKICTSETSVCVPGKISCKRVRPLQHVKNKMTVFRSLFIIFLPIVDTAGNTSTCSFPALSPQDIFYSMMYSTRTSSNRVSCTISSPSKPAFPLQFMHFHPQTPSSLCFSWPPFFLHHWCSLLSTRAALVPGSWFMAIFLSLVRTVCMI